MKKTVIVCCLSVLLGAVGLAGCTRSKPEIALPTSVPGTPTLAVAAETGEPTIPAPTATSFYTAEPQPTSILLTGAPTVISVTGASPTPPATSIPIIPTPAPGQFEYTVQWGDTLFSIARRFGTTVDALVALNKLPNASQIRVGQVLRIAGVPVPTPGTGQEYVVQAGDTLYSIARRFNTTVAAIQSANGIVNPWYISVGQRLVIPQGSTPPSSSGQTYTVQPGDTLYSIAARFSKNVWDIVTANNLADPYWILVGQVLVIP
jgi:LysM repeat protein